MKGMFFLCYSLKEKMIKCLDIKIWYILMETMKMFKSKDKEN
jgi:hypothetical protein